MVFLLLWSFASLVYLLNRPRVRGRLPTGPRLYAANHTSYADVYLASRALIRGLEPIWFLAKRELRDTPILGPLLSNTYIVFVDRDHPERAALEATVRAAQSGAVVIFPEGTRGKTTVLQEGKAGLGLVARLARVPVVPVSITGTRRPLWQLLLGRLNPAWRVDVVLGEPYLPPRGARAHEITDTIMRRIAAELPPERRGMYGDVRSPDSGTRSAAAALRSRGQEETTRATSDLPSD